MFGLHYGQQGTADYLFGTAAAPYTLTTSYVASLFKPIRSHAQATVFIEYTPGEGGNGNSIQLEMFGSPDELGNPAYSSPTFFQQTGSSYSGGVSTILSNNYTFVGATAGTTYRVYFYIPPALIAYYLAVKETIVGGAAGTTKVRVLLS